MHRQIDVTLVMCDSISRRFSMHHNHDIQVQIKKQKATMRMIEMFRRPTNNSRELHTFVHGSVVETQCDINISDASRIYYIIDFKPLLNNVLESVSWKKWFCFPFASWLLPQLDYRNTFITITCASIMFSFFQFILKYIDCTHHTWYVTQPSKAMPEA
jgi:hypothetical protein